MDGEHARHPQLHRPPRQRSRSSRSSSQDSAEIDELLIEASTDDVDRRLARSPRQMMGHGPRGHPLDMHPNVGYRPDSPIDYRGSPSGGPPGVSVMSGPAMHPDASGPLERPGQVQTYQTHPLSRVHPSKRVSAHLPQLRRVGHKVGISPPNCKILAVYGLYIV